MDMVFQTIKSQLSSFRYYSKKIEKNHEFRGLVIPEEKMSLQQTIIREESDTWFLFYFYYCEIRRMIKSIIWFFENAININKEWKLEVKGKEGLDGFLNRLHFADDCLFRPRNCFYTLKLNKEPVLGKSLQGLSVEDARLKIKEICLGLGPEAFQFLFITHSYYLHLMNSGDCPYLLLAGLRTSSNENVKKIPSIAVQNKTIIFGEVDVDFCNEKYAPAFFTEWR